MSARVHAAILPKQREYIPKIKSVHKEVFLKLYFAIKSLLKTSYLVRKSVLNFYSKCGVGQKIHYLGKMSKIILFYRPNI